MKICFVAPHAFPIACPSATGIFGGAEVQAVTLARSLAANSTHEVIFLARNPQLTSPVSIDDVNWIPWANYWQDLRREVLDHFELSSQKTIRLRSWSWSLLWKIPLLIVTNPFRRIPHNPRHINHFLARLDCDVFCCFGNNQEAATVLATAQKNRRPVILFLVHDDDVSEEYVQNCSYTNPTGQRGDVGKWVIDQAGIILPQTILQQELLATRFHRSSEVLVNPFDDQGWKALSETHFYESPWGNRPYFLWVGRADSHHKRPDRLLEIARLVPQLPFLMVLNPFDDSVETTIRHSAPENVKIVTKIPYLQMPSAFKQSQGLINTSPQEGFPNTYLQAIASRIPIFSWKVSPEFLELSKSGYFLNEDFTKACEIMQKIDSGEFPSPYQPDIAEEYLQTHFSLDAVTSRLKMILESLNRSPREITK